MATTSVSENEKLARRIPEDVATDGDVELLRELLAEDFVEHATDGDHEGIDQNVEYLSNLLESIPDFSATVEDTVAEGDMVALRVTLRGTPEEEFMGVPPTGGSFEISNMVFTRIEDGKIAERWVVPDVMGMARQLGVTELPSQYGRRRWGTVPSPDAAREPARRGRPAADG